MQLNELVNLHFDDLNESDLYIWNYINNHREVCTKITIEDLGKKCNVSRQTINAIENNKYDTTLYLAFKLSKELHITVDELFEPED